VQFKVISIALLCALVPLIPSAANVSDEENDIREAVYRYMFPDDAPKGEPDTLTLLCISFDKNGRDPADAFMKRFASHRPPVRKEKGGP
jgi:hypothetical protein